jgi:hypothetical protein
MGETIICVFIMYENLIGISQIVDHKLSLCCSFHYQNEHAAQLIVGDSEYGVCVELHGKLHIIQTLHGKLLLCISVETEHLWSNLRVPYPCVNIGSTV